jgi:branched-chain amino acid transport system substrate-binding protein
MKQPGTITAAISRRRIIAAGLGAVAAPAVLRVLPANAQSRVIKIGHVSPRTGPIAAFGEADPFILDQVQKLVEKGISNGGKTYPVQILSRDSQSSTARASEVAAELILRDKVDLLVTPPIRSPTRPRSTKFPASPPTVRGSPISSAATAIPRKASPGPIISSGGSRT